MSTEAQTLQDVLTDTEVNVEEVNNSQLPQNPYFEGNPFGDVVALDDEQKLLITNKKEELLSLIENNKDLVALQNLSENEKDKLFSQSEKMLTDYIDILRKLKFNFPINKDEHKCMEQVISDKLEYDVNDLFLALRLKFDFLNKIGGLKYKNDELRVLALNVDTVAILFHLLQKHKVKGLSHQSMVFAMLIRKLGEIKKESYNFEEEYKSLASIRNGWTASMQKDGDAPLQEPTSNVDTNTSTAV